MLLLIFAMHPGGYGREATNNEALLAGRDSYATKHPAAGDFKGWHHSVFRARHRQKGALATNSRTARNKPDGGRIMHTCVRTFQGRSFHFGWQKVRRMQREKATRAIVVLSKYSRPIDRSCRFMARSLKYRDMSLSITYSKCFDYSMIICSESSNYAQDIWRRSIREKRDYKDILY